MRIFLATLYLCVVFLYTAFTKLSVGLPVRTQAEVQGIAETEPLLEDDRHVVEVGPGGLEGGLAEPVLRAAVPGIVDADLRR